MKKNLTVVLILILLCMGTALSQEEDRAAFFTTAPLLAAPNGAADELMVYYTGTPVEIIRDMANGYKQVNVGAPNGGMMGYVWSGYLVTGAEAEREKEIVECVTTEETCRLYSKPDGMLGVVEERIVLGDCRVLGLRQGEWLHVMTDDGQTGFVSMQEITIKQERHYQLLLYGAPPAEDALSVEAAIREAKIRLLADHKTGANLNLGMDNLTEEGFDQCNVEVRILDRMKHPGTQLYEIDFRRPNEYYCYAYIVLVVEGDRVIEHNYGNG